LAGGAAARHSGKIFFLPLTSKKKIFSPQTSLSRVKKYFPAANFTFPCEDFFLPLLDIC
jgi:hypothetical protein